ncbi:MAG: polysaccharide biosynthesis tyrosine autokinase [Pirellulaceae bacterium]
MSQVMDSPVVNGSPNMRTVEGMPMGEPQQGFDILKVLWRWKWLPILGSIIGTGLGYLYFSKQPAQYQASALVRVVASLPQSTRNNNIQAYDPNEVADFTRQDESRIIKSQLVLRNAVEKGNLTDQPALKGMTVDQIAAMLSGKNLVVQPGGKDANTALLEISYICNDAELAAIVVNAVVSGYSEFLSEEYRTVGREVHDLVTNTQKKLEEQFKKIYERNEQFRESAKNVIWSGTEATDPYIEIYMQVNAEVSALQVERERLHAELAQVEEGIAANRPPEQLLVMLSSGEHELLNTLYHPPVAPRIEQPSVEITRDTQSSRLEDTKLFELEMRLQELLEKNGDAHPSVNNQRLRIQIMKQKIAELAASEKQEELEMARLRKEAEEAAAEQNVAPVGITVEQRLAIRVNALREKEAALEKQLAGLKSLASANLAKSQELGVVMRENRLMNLELESVAKLLEPYTEKVNAIQLLPDAGQRTLKVLEVPQIGGFYGPKLPPYLLGGAAIGFLIMSGLAVLMDLADRSYRSPDEIAADLGVNVLGHIPIIDIAKVKKVVEAVDASVTTIHHSRGRVSEAYRSVRTGLFFSNRGSELKLIQVTSPVPGDGKSTLSSNLAVTMAQSGRRVLLIDADFRRPRIAKIFGIDAEVGMAQVVAGKAELDEATYTSSVANLSIMPGGKRPSNPAELLSSQRFQELLELLRDKYDIVIVDTPPLLAVSDPSAVSAMVDGVVMTMRLRRNVKPLATRAAKILESVDARLLGVVVNGVSAEAGYGYSYGYNDYRYAYRYGGNYRYSYKYGYGSKYGGYSAGYIDDKQDVPPPANDGQSA